MYEFFLNIYLSTEKLFFIFAIGLAIEWLRPVDKNQPAKAVAFNFIWIINYFLIANALLLVFGRYVGPAIELLGGPIFTLSFADNWWGYWANFAIWILMYDFFYYWFHRAQHKWKWFWMLHKLHHDDRYINATTSFRHHWMEGVYRIPFMLIPMGFILEMEATTPAMLFDVALVWAIFVHMNFRLELGKFSWLAAGPQVHRLHHSILPQHQDKNLCAFFPIWDVLFGTYVAPKPGEYPPVGLVNGEETWSLWDANTMVFRDWYGMFQESRTKRKDKKLEN